MSAADLDPFEDLSFTQQAAPSEQVTARIKHECTRDLQPRPGASLQKRLAMTALVASLGLLAIVGIVGGLSRVREQLESALYGVLGWAAVLSLVLAIGVARPPGRRVAGRLRWWVLAVVPVLFFVYLGLVASEVLPLEHALPDGGTMACGLYALLASAVVALCVMLPWRGTDPFQPGLTGALLALGGGLAAAVAMGVVCPNREGWHLWVAHGLTLVTVILAGAWVGRRWLAP